VGGDTVETRIGTSTAAKYLGCTTRHVESLIRDGTLEAWDVRREGKARARWSVTLASVRYLLARRYTNMRTERTDAGGTPKPADSTPRRGVS